MGESFQVNAISFKFMLSRIKVNYDFTLLVCLLFND